MTTKPAKVGRQLLESTNVEAVLHVLQAKIGTYFQLHPHSVIHNFFEILKKQLSGIGK